ncbi:MAG: ADP-forming succinate--CoA ligase subunit beta [Actinomycetota bacterium]|nr:ADP-forming succinate--CoA ligase subunit beta [Actinomycetota bacterium]
MDLLEYQGKQLFAKHGVPVPSGRLARDVESAVQAAEEIGYPCVIKAQVQIGGRGKAGGIKIAADRDEAERQADAILGMEITGPHGEGPFSVQEVWIERASEIDDEYYFSLIIDRSEKKVLSMLSTMGGMDVEAIADKDPEALSRRHVEPGPDGGGFGAEQAERLAADAGVPEDVRAKTAAVMAKLYDSFMASDATLIEVNPLIVTKDRDALALDAKVTIDNSALFRHEDIAELEEAAVEDPQERMAKEKSLTYVKLDGDIGILGNGAGLCMATLDVVAQAGGDPANFLDAGGGSKADAIVDALEVISSDEKVKAILFNIFGGITRGDEVAKGIIEASQRIGLELPLVVRLDGTNSEQGLKLLADANLGNLHQEKTMLGAAERVVALAREGG